MTYAIGGGLSGLKECVAKSHANGERWRIRHTNETNPPRAAANARCADTGLIEAPPYLAPGRRAPLRAAAWRVSSGPTGLRVRRPGAATLRSERATQRAS